MLKPKRKKPITSERIEKALDILAGIMAKAPREEAALAVPLWRRLEAELEKIREEEDVINLALNRLKRSKDQTAARS